MTPKRHFSRLLMPLSAFLLVSIAFGCGGGSDGPTAPPGGGGGGNHAPTVNLNISQTVFNPGQTAQLTATPADPDGDQLTLSWRAKYGTVNSSGPTATTATYVATSGWGRDTIFVTVSDGHGGSAEGTAGVYIRNLNTPTIALFPVAPTNPNCPGFALQVTPTEDLLVTAFHIWPGGASSGCGYDPNYAPPLLLRAGVPYVFRDVSCIYPECSGDPVGYYTIVINGRRPDPDGGTYAFSCVTWRTSNPTACQ